MAMHCTLGHSKREWGKIFLLEQMKPSKLLKNILLIPFEIHKETNCNFKKLNIYILDDLLRLCHLQYMHSSKESYRLCKK
jgi:hypothetical protein